MSSRTPIPVNITGVETTKTPADPTGELFMPGRCALLVQNRHATAPRTVTILVPGLTKYDQPNPDVSIVVAAGDEVTIGPFPDDLAASGRVGVTYSNAADLWVALIELSGRISATYVPPIGIGYGLALYGLGGYGA